MQIFDVQKNNTSKQGVIPDPNREGVIPDPIKEGVFLEHTFLLLELTIGVIMRGVAAVIGVMSNSVNVIVFWLLGLKDSMSVCLFVLSVTDLLVSGSQVGSTLCVILDKIYPNSQVDFSSLAYITFGWARYATFLISCWITAMISAERCFCVVSPFKVKQLFTRSRCVIVLGLIYSIHFAIISPVYIYERMEWVERESRDTNETAPGILVFSVVLTQQTTDFEIMADTLAGIVLSMTSQSVLVVCSLWMIYN